MLDDERCKAPERIEALLSGGRREALAVLCQRHAVRRLAFFGSVLREDFNPEASDVDAVVSFGDPQAESLAEQYFEFKHGLETLLARCVDLVEMEVMPDTRLKRLIERTMVPIYGQ